MTKARNFFRNAALVVPVLLVNAVAVYGQAGWAHANLGIGGWWAAIAFALTVESIGVYLAIEAHDALMTGQASGGLRLGSMAVGALGGTLNYAHFSGPDWRPTALALAFAGMSTISPLLWAIRSRAMNRARLMAEGLIDPRAVKFSRLRWLLFPGRSFGAFRLAVWEGTQAPAAAIERYELSRPPSSRVVQQRAASFPPAWTAEEEHELRMSVDDGLGEQVDRIFEQSPTLQLVRGELDEEPATPPWAPPPARPTREQLLNQAEANARRRVLGSRDNPQRTQVLELAARKPDLSARAIAAELDLPARTVQRYLQAQTRELPGAAGVDTDPED